MTIGGFASQLSYLRYLGQLSERELVKIWVILFRIKALIKAIYLAFLFYACSPMEQVPYLIRRTSSRKLEGPKG